MATTIPQAPQNNTGNVAPNPNAAWSSILPGFTGLTSTATGNAGQALSGNVPTDVINNIQNQAAAWGVSAGQPGFGSQSLTSGQALKNLGLTSLGQQQTGQNDLLGLIGGYSGTVAPTTGQALQNNQFYSNLAQSGQEFDANNALGQFNALINAAGLFNPAG
jgi:hypothetical protein